MKNLISDTNAVHNLKTTTKLFKESLDDFFKLFDSSPSAMVMFPNLAEQKEGNLFSNKFLAFHENVTIHLASPF
jgi:hypothetical protein